MLQITVLFESSVILQTSKTTFSDVETRSEFESSVIL